METMLNNLGFFALVSGVLHPQVKLQYYLEVIERKATVTKCVDGDCKSLFSYLIGQCYSADTTEKKY